MFQLMWVHARWDVCHRLGALLRPRLFIPTHVISLHSWKCAQFHRGGAEEEPGRQAQTQPTRGHSPAPSSSEAAKQPVGGHPRLRRTAAAAHCCSHPHHHHRHHHHHLRSTPPQDVAGQRRLHLCGSGHRQPAGRRHKGAWVSPVPVQTRLAIAAAVAAAQPPPKHPLTNCSPGCYCNRA
jgi:hypothetical protein